MLKIAYSLFLIAVGVMLGITVSFVITFVFVGEARDYYLPIYAFILLAMFLGPAGGALGGYYAWHLSHALDSQAMDVSDAIEEARGDQDDMAGICVWCPSCTFEEVLPIRAFGTRRSCGRCGVAIDIGANEWDATQDRS